MSVTRIPTLNTVDKSATPALLNVCQQFQWLTSPETLVYLHQNSKNSSLAEWTRNERAAGSESTVADHAWSMLNETGVNSRVHAPLLEPDAGEYDAVDCMGANHMDDAVVWTMTNESSAKSKVPDQAGEEPDALACMGPSHIADAVACPNYALDAVRDEVLEYPALQPKADERNAFVIAAADSPREDDAAGQFDSACMGLRHIADAVACPNYALDAVREAENVTVRTNGRREEDAAAWPDTTSNYNNDYSNNVTVTTVAAREVLALQMDAVSQALWRMGGGTDIGTSDDNSANSFCVQSWTGHLHMIVKKVMQLTHADEASAVYAEPTRVSRQVRSPNRYSVKEELLAVRRFHIAFLPGALSARTIVRALRQWRWHSRLLRHIAQVRRAAHTYVFSANDGPQPKSCAPDEGKSQVRRIGSTQGDYPILRALVVLSLIVPVSATAGRAPVPDETPYVAVFALYVLFEYYIDLTVISARYATKLLPMLTATILVMLIRRHMETQADQTSPARDRARPAGVQPPPGVHNPWEHSLDPLPRYYVEPEFASWSSLRRRERRQRSTRARPVPPMPEASYSPPARHFDDYYMGPRRRPTSTSTSRTSARVPTHEGEPAGAPTRAPHRFRRSQHGQGVRALVLATSVTHAHAMPVATRVSFSDIAGSVVQSDALRFVIAGVALGILWSLVKARLGRRRARPSRSISPSIRSTVCVLLLCCPLATWAASDDELAGRRVPLWHSTDGYGHWRVFFGLLAAHLAQLAMCSVFVRSQPEKLNELHGLSEDDTDTLTRYGFSTIHAYRAANCRAWGVLMQATRGFPEVQTLVLDEHGDFVKAVAAITAHVTGHVADMVIDLKEEVEARFSSVTTAIELRAALAFFSRQQRILATIDTTDRSYSDDDARTFLLRCLRRQSVGLVHVYHTARLPGDQHYASYAQLKVFLDTHLPKPHDEVQSTTPRHGMLEVAAAVNVPRQPPSRNPRHPSRQAATPSASQSQRGDLTCFKCGRRFATKGDVYSHIRRCRAKVTCSVPGCEHPHSHQTAYHDAAIRLKGPRPSSSGDTATRAAPDSFGQPGHYRRRAPAHARQPDSQAAAAEPADAPLYTAACMAVLSMLSTLCCGLDSMAGSHLVGDASLLMNTTTTSLPDIVTADGGRHKPTCRGSLPVLFRDDSNMVHLVLVHNVLAMPNWPKTRVLFSVGQWEQLRDVDGNPVVIKTDHHLLFKTSRRTLRVPYDRALVHTVTVVALGPGAEAHVRAEVPSRTFPDIMAAAATPTRPEAVTSRRVQQRLAFVNARYVADAVAHGRGLRLTDRPADLPKPSHEAVLQGMSRRAPLVKSPANSANSTTRNNLHRRIDTIHMDAHGGFAAAVNGAKHFVSFHSNHKYGYVWFTRDLSATSILNGLKAACLEMGLPRELRMDRSQVLVRNDPIVVTAFQQHCLDNGIAFKISPPRHQEHDGVAEKAGGRDLYEHATALLAFAGLPVVWWPYAIQHAVDAFNRIPRPSLGGQSPYSLHFDEAPDLSTMRTFGCPAWVHVDKASRGPSASFRSRVSRGLHLGMARDSPPMTYLIYKFATKRIVVSRDVHFDEDFELVERTPTGWQYSASRLERHPDLMGQPTAARALGGADEDTATPTTSGTTATDAAVLDDDAFQAHWDAAPTHRTSESPPIFEPEESPDIVPPELSSDADSEEHEASTTPASAPVRPAVVDSAPDVDESDVSSSPLRRSTRTVEPPRRYDPDSFVPDHLWTEACAGETSESELPPLTDYLEPDWDHCDNEFHSFAARHGLEPAQAAYRKELHGIIDAQVLSEPVTLPPGRRALSTRVLMREKTDGTLKARLCVRGCHQRHGVDYDAEQTYAGVTDRISMRIVLAIACALHALIETVDITAAFLNGKMPPTYRIFVKAPQGLSFGVGKVCQLLKSLYGLKQAPAIFRSVLHGFILSQGFTECFGDECCYSRVVGPILTLLAVHVDDILIVCTDRATLDNFKDALKSRFDVKDQGSIDGHQFLGLEAEYDRERGLLQLHCDSYLKRSLTTLGIDYETTRAASTPVIKRGTPGSPAVDEVPLRVDQLRQLSGILSYAAMACRPDLAVAASLLSSTKWNDITTEDLNAGKRAIQYISHTLQRMPKLGLRYNAQVFSTLLAATTLMCFADSDYAGDMSTCRSRSGHVIMLCNAAIYWSSKLQDTIALSSTAAELTSISDLCRRLVWIAELMRHLTFPQRLVAMYEDNKPAIAVAYRENLSHRVRHMRIRDLWVRELCRTELCRIYYCSTTDNLSDFFTKVLTGRPFRLAVAAFTGCNDVLFVAPPQRDLDDFDMFLT